MTQKPETTIEQTNDAWRNAAMDALSEPEPEFAPYNPWPIGSDWWSRTNKMWRSSQVRKGLKRL